MDTHVTFLTSIPSLFVIIPAFSSLSPSTSFRLNKTFPCHGILKVVNMCMSNAMNMDVTSFFGACPPPPQPHGGTRHYSSMSTACVRDTDMASPALKTHTLIDTHQRMTLEIITHAQIYTRMHTHRGTDPTLMLLLLLSCLSSLTFHNVFYIKIKEGE